MQKNTRKLFVVLKSPEDTSNMKIPNYLVLSPKTYFNERYPSPNKPEKNLRIPLFLVQELIDEGLSCSSKDIVLNNFPNTKEEAIFLKEFLSQRGMKMQVLIGRSKEEESTEKFLRDIKFFLEGPFYFVTDVQDYLANRKKIQKNLKGVIS